MNTLGLILLPSMLTSSISLPLEIFNAAFDIAITQRLIRKRPKVLLLSGNLEQVKSNTGLAFTPTAELGLSEAADVLIVPSLWRSTLDNTKSQFAVCDYINKLGSEQIICAVGTGSALLAEAGILDNKSATTHWYYFDQMEKNYPNVNWRRQHLITQSDNVYCAGSVNSVADLSIHIIRKIYGDKIAELIEQQFSPEARQPMQTLLFDATDNHLHKDELVAEIQRYIHDNLQETINFQQLAEKHKTTARTLQRRFKASTGSSPLQYQQSKRMDTAKGLLANSNESIEGISNLLGYSDSSQFSRLFRKHTQVNPTDYRKNLRGKLFDSDN